MRKLVDSHLFGRLNLSFKCLAMEREVPFPPNHLQEFLSDTIFSGRPLHGGRGLKPVGKVVHAQHPRRPLHGGRGLKHNKTNQKGAETKSPPSRGGVG